MGLPGVDDLSRRWVSPGRRGVVGAGRRVVSVALANAQALATLRHQASNDGLTGLLNHRAFQQRLHEEHDRARRHGRPVALCVLDLDGFTEIRAHTGTQFEPRLAEDLVLNTITSDETARPRRAYINLARSDDGLVA